MAAGGFMKPSYVAFELLHQLGKTRVENGGNDVIVTKRPDGTLVIAIWNLVDPDQIGAAKSIRLRFSNVGRPKKALVQQVDELHSDSLVAYKQMGGPRYPSQTQIQALRKSAALMPPQRLDLHDGSVNLLLLPNELAIVTLQ